MDWRLWCNLLVLEDSPRMLQKEKEKSLGATLVAAVERFSVVDIYRLSTSGCLKSPIHMNITICSEMLVKRSRPELIDSFITEEWNV